MKKMLKNVARTAKFSWIAIRFTARYAAISFKVSLRFFARHAGVFAALAFASAFAIALLTETAQDALVLSAPALAIALFAVGILWLQDAYEKKLDKAELAKAKIKS